MNFNFLRSSSTASTPSLASPVLHQGGHSGSITPLSQSQKIITSSFITTSPHQSFSPTPATPTQQNHPGNSSQLSFTADSPSQDASSAPQTLDQGISLLQDPSPASNYQAVAIWKSIISSAGEDGDTLRQAKGIACEIWCLFLACSNVGCAMRKLGRLIEAKECLDRAWNLTTL